MQLKPDPLGREAEVLGEDFARFVREKLRPHESSLRSQLRQLIEHEYPAEVVAIEFEVFADGFTSGFPVFAYFVDSARTEFFLDTADGPAYPCPIDPGLLDIPCVYSKAEEAGFAERDANPDSFSVAAETFILWFADQWHAAGGGYFRIAADIGIHDGARRLDLHTNSWLAA